jgi:hypothetical protein
MQDPLRAAGRPATIGGMAEPQASTMLFRTESEAVSRLRSVVAQIRKSDEELREAVMAARAIKLSWSAIGSAMGISRQAAAERFGGDLRYQLVTAWHSIEVQLARIADKRGLSPIRPLECLGTLSDEGLIDPNLRQRALDLWSARAKAVHDPHFDIALEEAQDLTEVALPIAGVLYMIASEL